MTSPIFFSINLQVLYTVLSQKSSWISILKYWCLQFLILFLKVILWITGRRNGRIQNWRVMCVREILTLQSSAPHSELPRTSGKARGCRKLWGSIREGRFSLRVPVQVPWSEPWTQSTLQPRLLCARQGWGKTSPAALLKSCSFHVNLALLLFSSLEPTPSRTKPSTNKAKAFERSFLTNVLRVAWSVCSHCWCWERPCVRSWGAGLLLAPPARAARR